MLKPSATGSLAAGSGCKVRVKVLRMLRRQRLHNYFSRAFALPLLCQHLNRRVTFEYCVSVAWNRARWWLGGMAAHAVEQVRAASPSQMPGVLIYRAACTACAPQRLQEEERLR